MERTDGTSPFCEGKYTVEELGKKIDEYFETCKPHAVEDRDGNRIWEGENKVVWTHNCPTINGLCRFLGYRGVTYMNNVLKHNTPRSHLLEEAVTRIAEWHESRLGDKNSAGSQFWLKCAQKDTFGDKREIDVRAAVGHTQVDLSADEEEAFLQNMGVIFKGADVEPQ